MKTPFPRPRYRVPRFWTLYRVWESYKPRLHRHKWIRISGDGSPNTRIVCVQCGEEH